MSILIRFTYPNLPSASTSLIISCNSASVGFCPNDRMTVPNSFVVIVPSPSLSNSEKASLNSAICSSVSWSAYTTKICYEIKYYFIKKWINTLKILWNLSPNKFVQMWEKDQNRKEIRKTP